MRKKETSPEVSASAARILNLSDDQIYEIVTGPSNTPNAVRQRGVGFEQFCREVRSIAASALVQDETPKRPRKSKTEG